MQYFLFFIGFINLNFSSLSADANQEVTKRVITVDPIGSLSQQLR